MMMVLSWWMDRFYVFQIYTTFYLLHTCRSTTKYHIDQVIRAGISLCNIHHMSAVRTYTQRWILNCFIVVHKFWMFILHHIHMWCVASTLWPIYSYSPLADIFLVYIQDESENSSECKKNDIWEITWWLLHIYYYYYLWLCVRILFGWKNMYRKLLGIYHAFSFQTLTCLKRNYIVRTRI